MEDFNWSDRIDESDGNQVVAKIEGSQNDPLQVGWSKKN